MTKAQTIEQIFDSGNLKEISSETMHRIFGLIADYGPECRPGFIDELDSIMREQLYDAFCNGQTTEITQLPYAIIRIYTMKREDSEDGKFHTFVDTIARFANRGDAMDFLQQSKEDYKYDEGYHFYLA